jgi:hypothetical protein
MGVETGDTIATLNETWPSGTEPYAQGDDHIRQIKHVLKSDALSKAAGGTLTAPIDLAIGSTIGGEPIGSDVDLSGKADVIHYHSQLDISGLTTDLNTIRNDITNLESVVESGGGGGGGGGGAPLDSPAFTGTPTAPTAGALSSTDQIATTAFVTAAVAAGTGSDFDSTPVAAIGSSIEQTIPEWLAGAPIIEITGELFIGADHRGAWIHCMNDIGTTLYLPGDWSPGWSFGARQIGVGPVSWAAIDGSSMQVPFTKADHTGILEQYEEVVFRVISNVDGVHAVWGFSGATA